MSRNRRAEASCIQTVTGRGYRFVATVTRGESELTPAPNFNTRESGASLAREGPRGLSQHNCSGGILPPVSRAGRPFSRRIHATIAGAAILLAAIVAWNWHSFRLGATHPAPRLSIVVLPFANLSNDPEQQYFVNGITEDLTTDLSRIAGSFVISHNTAFTYIGKPLDAKQIGKDLSVRYLLEGSVQRSGNQVRVNAQLIDADARGAAAGYLPRAIDPYQFPQSFGARSNLGGFGR